MKKYERVAGIVTRGETYMKLREHLIECEELCAVMGHLHQTEDTHRDELMATGWRGMSQMMALVRSKIEKMMVGKLQ
jgi:hypothetical protein